MNNREMKQIDASAKIAETAIIHDNVKIEAGVIIHDYVVIYPNTVISRGCEIYDHCVFGKLPTSLGVTSRKLKPEYEKLYIGENCILCPGMILYTGSTIGNNNLLGDFLLNKGRMQHWKRLYYRQK